MHKFTISICIPAYKRVNYLERLLNSIAAQSFKDFEVVVFDDSPDGSVEELVKKYTGKFAFAYYKNKPSLGTPANWNAAIKQAKGEWIKLVHDDDWFASPASLQVFADNIKEGNRFIFSAYTNCYEEESRREETVFFPILWKSRIIDEPVTLLAHNVVGPPSVTMLHKTVRQQYDERMKWRVDMDFYVCVLTSEKKFSYINQALMNVGVSASQVTNVCFENPLVELPEGFLLLEKYGIKPLNNILVYDAWWRLLRNMHINNTQLLTRYEPKEWPAVIKIMTKHLGNIPPRLLKNGVISKILMSLSFLTNGGRKGH